MVFAGLIVAGLIVAGLPAPEARAQVSAQPGAPSQELRSREAMLAVEGLGHLASTLRAYAQLGHRIEPELARERMVASRRELDALLERLLGRAGRHMPPADVLRLQQRWRTVRDATYTRPSAEIAGLMGEIAGDLAGQLRMLAAPRPGAAADRLQAAERAWQRQNLQWLVKEGLFGCWREDLVQLEETERLKSEFDRWLAAQERRLSHLIWVQYNAQWNLLTTSLPRTGSAGCTEFSMRSLVATADRLSVMLASLQ